MQLIPHVDVVFLNKYYAQTHSPDYAGSPRTFLLSLASIVSPHALLVGHWGKDGAAVLSMPTREYFQSSCWVEERSSSASTAPPSPDRRGTIDVRSVRTGSDFWADGRSRDSNNSYSYMQHPAGVAQGHKTDMNRMYPDSSRHTQMDSRGESMVVTEGDDEEDRASQDTERGRGNNNDGVYETGAYDAFIAGMIYALSRRICPGAPYTPSSGGREDTESGRMRTDDLRARWRLDECLRFATELAGRKARRKTWEGLASEMLRAGWFDVN